MGQLTFLEAASRVLEVAVAPLTGPEVWRTVERLGLVSLVDSKGKTPAKTLEAQLYVSTKEDPDSPFVRVGESGRTLFWLKDRPLSNDALEDPLAGSDETAGAPISFDTPVRMERVERSIFELARRRDLGQLDLQPDFQRGDVWKPAQRVALVESVLLRIPLPVIYLSNEDEERSIVIDGKQRLTTLFRFLKNEFRLRGLRLIGDLEGKTFRELDARVQRRFEDTTLTAFVLLPGADPNLKFEIFQRLNQGGVALTEMEIRNCVFMGPGLTLIKAIAEPGHAVGFVEAIGRKLERLRDAELVLRGLTFLEVGAEGYPGDMKKFLNDGLRRLNSATPDARDALEARLRQAVAASTTVFGPSAFRRWNPDAAKFDSLNAALFDAVLLGFDRVRRSPEYWETNREHVIALLRSLHSDEAFTQAIMYATGSNAAVRTRIERWVRGLEHVARDHP